MKYFDVDVYSRPVSTKSPDAQRWFDRGLVWCYAYCHEEAVRCFSTALKHDANCAMAHWGIAYASGPNYNMPWDKFDEASKAEALRTAHDATQAAMSLRNGASVVERALIEALPARYPQEISIEDQSPWNDAYADAMREAFHANRDDLDARALFAEAIMNRTPWKMWDLRSGCPAEGAGTAEAQQILEEALDKEPAAHAHPGILHLYVHLMEMSPYPEKALRAADELRELVPDAGHLIHMPTHIDILCGNYRDVLYWNRRAIAVDRKYAEKMGPFNIYTAYRLHNYHFAIYGAMFLGQYKPAITIAEEILDTVPEELLRVTSPPMADFMESYLSMKQHVYIRFGKWREIIAQKLPDDREIYSNLTATVHYAKGVGHAALGEISEAERERKNFLAAKIRVPESRLLHNNTCRDLLDIAEEMLNGEIEYRKGNFDSAFAHLRNAVALDDSLPYDEPWGWIQPARHALGALLLEQQHVGEAEIVYREDLGLAGKLSRAVIHPDNIWSLRGLYDCLVRLDRTDTAEAASIRQRLDLAAARAEIPVDVSCFCAGMAAA